MSLQTLVTTPALPTTTNLHPLLAHQQEFKYLVSAITYMGNVSVRQNLRYILVGVNTSKALHINSQIAMLIVLSSLHVDNDRHDTCSMRAYISLVVGNIIHV